MKTPKEELEEVIDLTIKFVWNYTVFRALFEKGQANWETRQERPEFFQTIYESLLCGFCTATEILFEEKEKATSFWSLIRKSKPELANALSARIRAHNDSIKTIEALRHQVFAHRWQARVTQQVFAEAQPRVSMMTEIVNLARFVILQLVEAVDPSKRAELEKQQLSETTLCCIADDARAVMAGFSITAC